MDMGRGHEINRHSSKNESKFFVEKFAQFRKKH